MWLFTTLKGRLLLGTIAVLLFGGLGGWWYLTGSPQYSLYQYYQALEARDFPASQKYLDLKGEWEGHVEDIKKCYKDKTGNEISEGDQNDLNENKQKYVDDSIGKAKKEIENGEMLDGKSAPDFWTLFRTSTVNRTGKISSVTFLSPSGKQRTIKMRALGHYWQIFEWPVACEEFEVNWDEL